MPLLTFLSPFQDLVSKLSNDPATNIGVLQVAHSIFKRWRPLFQSNELYKEINHVLEKFGTPFLSLFEVRSVFSPSREKYPL